MNYFNYFTEIEEHFQRQRGAQIWLSPVDWALIASWKEAGIPLEAVLAGIDRAFEKFSSGRRADTGRKRSLVYCAAAVLESAETARQMAVGAHAAGGPASAKPESDGGFSPDRVREHLKSALAALAANPVLDGSLPVVVEVRETLERLADGLAGPSPVPLQEIDRVLTVLDDKVFAALEQAAPVAWTVELKAAMERELAPYRRKLRAEQYQMIERQFLRRRLLERAGLPRFSLFYMG